MSNKQKTINSLRFPRTGGIYHPFLRAEVPEVLRHYHLKEEVAIRIE